MHLAMSSLKTQLDEQSLWLQCGLSYLSHSKFSYCLYRVSSFVEKYSFLDNFSDQHLRV